jgi:hypothetical protein
LKLCDPRIHDRLSMKSKLLSRRVKRLAGSPAVLYAPEKLTDGYPVWSWLGAIPPMPFSPAKSMP